MIFAEENIELINFPNAAKMKDVSVIAAQLSRVKSYNKVTATRRFCLKIICKYFGKYPGKFARLNIEFKSLVELQYQFHFAGSEPSGQTNRQQEGIGILGVGIYIKY